MKKVLLGLLAVVTVFSLVGCGNKEKVVENTPTSTEVPTQQETNATARETVTEENAEEVVEKLPEERVNELQEVVNQIEVSSDDNKIVFKQAENITGIYYHDGEKITGMETRIEYETPELALAAKTSTELDNEEDIESVEQEGNTLVVTYKASAYENTTLEEVKQSAALIQALQGAN